MSETEKDVAVDGCEQDEQVVNTPKAKSRNPQFEAARAKAHEERRKLGAISRAKKLEAKQQRDAEYERAMKVLGGVKEEPVHVEPEPKLPVSKPRAKAKKKKVIEIEQSSSESDESCDTDASSDTDGSIEIVRVRRKKAAPPPKKTVRKKKRVVSESSEEEDNKEISLGGKVAREMLRQRVLKQATEDVIRRLVPYYRSN